MSPLRFALGLTLVASLSCARASFADDEPKDPPAKPVVLVTVAGIERALEDVGFLFGNVDRPDMTEFVLGLLGNVNDLKGLDRKQPIGFALYLAPGLIPQPLPVAYVPVDDIDDLLETAELGPVTTKPVSGKKGRYQIDGGQRSLFVQVRDGYALVSNDVTVLDMELESPVSISKALVARYDMAAAVYVDNVPKSTRDFFLTLLQSSALAELQQRDGESDAVYRLRSANAKRSFELINMLLKDGREIVIGWDVSEEKRKAVLEIAIEATPDSEFAQFMTDSAGQASLFDAAVRDDVPLGFALSSKMDEPGAEVVVEALRVAELEVAKAFARNAGTLDESSAEPVEDEGVSRLMAPLIATAKKRKLDGFVRMNGTDAKRMALVGGLHVRNADDLADALLPFLQRIGELDEIADVTTSVDTAQGVAIHRVTGSKIRDEDRRIYGDEPSLYVGAGRRAVWFAVGGEAALAELRSTMDTVLTATPADETDTRSPFRFTFHMKPWMGLPPRNEERGQRFREMVGEAMAKGEDALRINVKPTENGARFRVEIEEGFLRMMGLGISRGMDRWNERQEPEGLPEPPADAADQPSS